MQYVLTEAEYRELKSEQRQKLNGTRAELQEFCTKAAMHIPIVPDWSDDKTPRPWGCILGPREQHPGYCDDCPAQKVCPHDSKEWSQ